MHVTAAAPQHLISWLSQREETWPDHHKQAAKPIHATHKHTHVHALILTHSLFVLSLLYHWSVLPNISFPTPHFFLFSFFLILIIYFFIQFLCLRYFHLSLCPPLIISYKWLFVLFVTTSHPGGLIEFFSLPPLPQSNPKYKYQNLEYSYSFKNVKRVKIWPNAVKIQPEFQKAEKNYICREGWMSTSSQPSWFIIGRYNQAITDNANKNKKTTVKTKKLCSTTSQKQQFYIGNLG